MTQTHYKIKIQFAKKLMTDLDIITKEKVKTKITRTYTIPWILYRLMNIVLDLTKTICFKKKIKLNNDELKNLNTLCKKIIITKKNLDDLLQLSKIKNIIENKFNLLTEKQINIGLNSINSIKQFITIVKQETQ